MSMEMYCSNDLEVLAETLARHYARPRPDIFAPDTVVIQSLGMQRWLAMRLSHYCGICANMRFMFPNNFIKDIAGSLFEYDEQALAQSSREVAAWRLMQDLPNLMHKPQFAFLERYLAQDPLDIKLFQISQRLADLYDQYSLFRPQWVRNWPEANPEKLKQFAAGFFPKKPELQKTYIWQALLWQESLMPFALDSEWPFLINKLQGVLGDPLRAKKLPGEVFVFGISYLPPLYVDILRVLSRKMDIHLFMLNPSQGYWGDEPSMYQERVIKRDFIEQYEDLPLEELSRLAHIGGGNRLLGSWGGLGKQLFQKLWESDISSQEDFRDTTYDSMLHALQQDVLDMIGRGPRPAEDRQLALFDNDYPKLDFSPDDNSIQVHVCYSPLREIETLHDNLLEMFRRDSSLAPEDVVVTAPDINVYEPYISAVFQSRADDGRLDYSISDRSHLKQGLLAAFFMLLDLYKTRFEVDKVLALLEIDVIREAFGMETGDLAQLESWLSAAQIRWGLDARHKDESVGIKDTENHVDFPENTWRHGLERLLLSCAMPGNLYDGDFAGISVLEELPYDKKPLLGRLLDFVAAINHYYGLFRELHPPRRWQEILLGLLDTFFAGEARFVEKDLLQKALQKMTTDSEIAVFQVKIHLEVVRKYLEGAVEGGNLERGYLSHGVTFCSAKPMRSIPFRVVCFLGMDMETFPGKEHNASFDLVAQKRLRGDRSKRQDDKYLFLEALVSARDVFYVSYTGHNPADNSVVPPSPVVSELLETIENSFIHHNDKTPLDHVVTRHKMHGFDQAYYDGSEARLFSFSRDNYRIAQGGADGVRTSFIGGVCELSIAEQEMLLELSPREFAGFFLNPARFFAHSRLNISLESITTELKNKEPFRLSGLEEYAVQRRMIEMMLHNLPPGAILNRLRLEGLLPHGNLAPAAVSKIYVGLFPFMERIRAFTTMTLHNARPIVTNIDLFLNEVHIKGPLPMLCLMQEGRTRDGILGYFSFSMDKPAHKLSAWIYYLLALKQGLGTEGVFLDRSQRLDFIPPADVEGLLRELAILYCQGLQQPLAFFPKSGHAYAAGVFAKKEQPEKDALTKWCGNHHQKLPGEKDEPYTALCFTEEAGDDLPGDFYENAMKVFGPLLKNSVKAEEGGA